MLAKEHIRSLIRDICLKLNEIGTMSDLVRTKQGKFDIKDAIELSEVNENIKFLNIKDSIDMPMIEIDDFLYRKISNGSKLQNRYESEKIGFIYNDELVAIYIVDNNNSNVIKPKRILL